MRFARHLPHLLTSLETSGAISSKRLPEKKKSLRLQKKHYAWYNYRSILLQRDTQRAACHPATKKSQVLHRYQRASRHE